MRSVRLVTLMSVLALGACGEGNPPSVASAIADLNSTDREARTKAAEYLESRPGEAIPVLITEVNSYLPTEGGRLEGAARLSDLVRVLRSILVSQPDAATVFRSSDELATIRVLAWAAREGGTQLAVDATVVLASVIDNSGLCVIAHHLGDRTITESGLTNLAQVVTSVDPYRENAEALIAVADRIDPTRFGGGNRLENLIDSVRATALTSSRRFQPLPPEEQACVGYDYSAPI
jgi:hypothetical protein